MYVLAECVQHEQRFFFIHDYFERRENATRVLTKKKQLNKEKVY